MRAPFQILVLPYRRTPTGFEYAIVKRSDAGWWQFVAGGGEVGESPLEAALRETEEEIGVHPNAPLLELDSKTTVPKVVFGAAESWGNDVFVIPEHCFAANVGSHEIRLSGEHNEFQWVDYQTAREKLKWDSNRCALWELNERLKREQSSEQGRDNHGIRT